MSVIYIAQMDVAPEYEEMFNRVYDAEHVPEVLKVPGVISCRRYRADWKKIPEVPTYIAIYELESPDVVKSPEWEAAINRGEWPKVRPHTLNRLHGIYSECAGEVS